MSVCESFRQILHSNTDIVGVVHMAVIVNIVVGYGDRGLLFESSIFGQNDSSLTVGHVLLGLNHHRLENIIGYSLQFAAYAVDEGSHRPGLIAYVAV